MGPDTRALGERSSVPTVTQAQIASTVAALLGKDYRHDVPRAAAPIGDVIGDVIGAADFKARAPPVK